MNGNEIDIYLNISEMINQYGDQWDMVTDGIQALDNSIEALDRYGEALDALYGGDQ